jgi:hypothetical protein
MKPWVKVTVPLGLFVCAGALNQYVVRQQLASDPYVVVQRQIRPGEKFDSSALDSVHIPGDRERLRATLVPGDERDVILGMEARRELHPGDPVFWRDIKKPGVAVELGPDEFMLPVDLGTLPVETGLLFPGMRVDFCVAPVAVESRIAPQRPAGVGADSADDYHFVGPFRVLTVGRDATRAAAGAAASLSLTFDTDGRSGSRGNERMISVAIKVQADGKYDQASRRLLEALAGKRITAIILRPGSRA